MTWQDGSAVTGGQPGAEPSQEVQALRAQADLSGLPPLTRAVTERVILASADLDFASDLVCSEDWLVAAAGLLAQGAPVVADSQVTLAAIASGSITGDGVTGSGVTNDGVTSAGVTSDGVICKAGQSLTERLARTAAISRPAAAVRLAYGEAGPGALWVVGSEPLAIYEILSRNVQPALVIALPAGFVTAVETKKALREAGLPALSNVSQKGGPVVAAAACQALFAAAGTIQAAAAGSGYAGGR